MSNEQKIPPAGARKQDSKQNKLSSSLPSSPGDSPQVMTPHGVLPDQAAWRDRTERKISSADEASRADALLDEANDLSFPASDPIAIPSSPSERDKAKPQTGKK